MILVPLKYKDANGRCKAAIQTSGFVNFGGQRIDGYGFLSGYFLKGFPEFRF